VKPTRSRQELAAEQYQPALPASDLQLEPPSNDDAEDSEPPMQPPQLTLYTEAPSSLQAILSSHHVRTNFLKTPPRTEHFGYPTIHSGPKNYHPENMKSSLLTPNEEKIEHYPSYYQELAERFYTASGEAKIGPAEKRRPVAFAEEDSADDRISGNEEDEDAGQSKVESKENPLVNTAVIALKLSSKILDFYKTVSPYLPQ
jgi:hypothetical protein